MSERVFQAVKATPTPTDAVLRSGPSQARAAERMNASPMPPSVSEALRAPGHALDAQTRKQMESRFGHDFSRVRVHTDEQADVSTRDVSARAFTVGRDVVFREGQYEPHTESGRRLLAHELAHVVQQGDQHHAPQTLRMDAPDDQLEQAADRAASDVTQNRAPGSVGQEMTGASAPMLQRQPATPIDYATVDWAKGVEAVEKEAKAKHSADAEDHYKEMIIRAASHLKAPAPLKDKMPAKADINWTWKSSKGYAATADPKKVDNSPDDYWKWLTFNPAALTKDEAYTTSTILHELDHAAHAKTLYEEWKKSAKKGDKWDDFYIKHYEKWTEKEITVDKAGIIGALSDLPDKIAPSAIEFRAYTTQFVNFFHKVAIDKQASMALALVLFYPLKKQSVTATVSDPTLDLAKSRQQVLDYFNAPPVADKAQAEFIKTRIAAEFRSATLSRMSDAGTIKTDFKAIFDHVIDSDSRKEARSKYKPAPL
jgi:hypothetical protein